MRLRSVLLSAALLGALAGLGSGQEEQAPFRPGELVVYEKASVFESHYRILRDYADAGMTVLEVPVGQEQALADLLAKAGVRAGVNRVVHAFGNVNDPFASYQWHFGNVQAQQAWDVTHGEGVKVAVLDTGLKLGGPDGIGSVAAGGYDFAYNDSNTDDGNGHGTHVSGTICQASNNATGVAGLAYGCSVLPVKVLDDAGSGSMANIAAGVYHAISQGAKVINMSLGINARFGISHDAILDPALDAAYAAGVTVVCAAGNDGYRRNVSYPAIYPTTIAVGATDFRNVLTSYSNRGTGLDLVAPGGDSGRDDNGDGYGDGVLQETYLNGAWAYYFFDGTSMASPHVAATAALLLSHTPTMTPDDVRSALSQTALDLGSGGYDSTYGNGLIQAFAALNAGGGGGGGGGCTDADGDGWCVEDGDCDDNDPDVYPGHSDRGKTWGRDGKDNDCNGIIDG